MAPDSRNGSVPHIPYAADLMAGHAAIVTGGGSGLGRGIALGLASCGASVVVSGRKQEALDGTVAEITARGGTAAAVTCNVRDPDSVAQMVLAAEAAVGPVDVLVNNAGATFTAASETLSANAFRAVVETDAFGTFYACQEVGRRWIERGSGGAILNITSTSPMTGNPGRIHGGVGKAGVDSITKSLAVEWGRYGIRVNSLAPGFTPTAGVSKATRVEQASEDDLARLGAAVPLGRVGAIDDITWPAVFLVSPAAGFVNGASLTVDGGKWLSSGRTFVASEGAPISAPAPS
jgi:NAD(P)-dependent dehydrogenase (short-subunit alcohol dehydrogenase family)